MIISEINAPVVGQILGLAIINSSFLLEDKKYMWKIQVEK